MDQTTKTNQQTSAGENRREALQWLARTLNWEQRLGELRPHDRSEAKQAA